MTTMSSKPIILILCLVLIGSAAVLLAAGSPSAAKIRIPTALQSQDSLKIWIYFTDKGNSSTSLSPQVEVSVSALQRRAIRGAAVDYSYYDTQVNPDYVAEIESLVMRVRVKSRWLNAVSAWVKPEALDQIAVLPFVKKLTPVAQYIRRHIPEDEQPRRQGFNKPSGALQLDYGSSFRQLDQIGVVELQEIGYTGEGVRILMLDTGFKLSHRAFLHLDVDTTWDFINNDVDVEDASYQQYQQSHGTSTLSLIGAFAADTLIGAAYNATFLLAKTERKADDAQSEIADADDWIAGAEWGEPLGADILSSSLGYDSRTGLSYADLDGNTAPVTIAADVAASLGVIVVNSIGNDGHGSLPPSLISPSDGDSVIAVGAVDSTGLLTSFSSDGPTADGRIKPDVCAQGSGVVVATYNGSGYSKFGSGTSFSCPLTAGAIALLLEAHPDWTYGTLYSALTRTASRANSPDNEYGYGIVDAAAAIGSGELPEVSKVTAAPNPFNGSVSFLVPLETPGLIQIRLYTVAGEEVRLVEKQALSARTIPVAWDGTNADGQEVVNGVYLAYVVAPGIEEVLKVVKLTNVE